MDLFRIGFSVFTGDIMHTMNDKKSPEDSGSDSSKDSKDKQRVGSDSSKDKNKGQKHSEKGKNGHNTNDQESNDDPNSRLKTTPYDPRFPNQNQTRNCYQNYLDYHRCLKVKNDESFCHYYQWAYTELCPKAWTEKWDDQRERGIFAGQI